MNILVTGASGFIGRNLLKTLDDKGIRYFTLGKTNIESNNHINFDLLADEDIAEVLIKTNPTHLIHLAWFTEHGKYWTSPLNINWINATTRLLEAFCLGGGEHVLVAGTCAEYDWRYGYCVERVTPLAPKTLYGISKNCTRQIAFQICKKHEVRIAWTRLFFPFGEGESNERLIPSLFQVFRKERDTFGVNHSIYRDFLHVSDISDAITLCSTLKTQGEINICSGEPISLESVVKKISAICKVSPKKVLSLKSVKQNEPKFLIGSNTKLKNLGWKQRIPFQNGIENYLSNAII